MTIHLLGVNDRTASTALRDALALDAARAALILGELSGAAPEAVALSTCNRTEIYAAGEGELAPAMLSALARVSGLSEEALAHHTYRLSGGDAARHLFGVAAGLDSVVVGEGEILRQVRAAWDAARRDGRTGPMLNTLFRLALEAGKDVRSRTRVARGATSVAHAAVELGRKELGTLAGRTVLVLGAGETGRIAALNLRSAGAGRIVIANRTLARARALAGTLGGDAIALDGLPAALRDADLLLACSSAAEPLVHAETLARSLADRAPRRPLLVVDIAVPRNVDPAAREAPGVVLYDMDDIRRLCDENRHARSMAARRARTGIEAWVERFTAWERERAATPLLRRITADAERVRAEEVERALGALPGLSERERAAVEALGRALSGRLLHPQLRWLRRESTPAQRAALERALGETEEERR